MAFSIVPKVKYFYVSVTKHTQNVDAGWLYWKAAAVGEGQPLPSHPLPCKEPSPCITHGYYSDSYLWFYLPIIPSCAHFQNVFCLDSNFISTVLLHNKLPQNSVS